jgi:hypothetical protein
VTGPEGRLAPAEINLRLTGPSAAFMVKLRLDETRGGDHVVCVQLPVAQPGAVDDHGGAVRLAPRPVLEQLVKRSP